MSSVARSAGQLSLLDSSPVATAGEPLIRVVIPCSKWKVKSPEYASREDLDLRRAVTEARLAPLAQPARDLYAGRAYQRSLASVDRFADLRPDLPIALHIASAGYGIVPSGQLLVPYEAVMGAAKTEWIARGTQLDMPRQAQELVNSTGLTVFALSQPYFHGAAVPAITPGGRRVIVIGVGDVTTTEGVQTIIASRPQARAFGTTEREIASVVLGKLLDHIAANGIDAATSLPADPTEWPAP